MFCIDERLQSTCFLLGEWPLSSVLLKNDSQFPWFLLVPRKNNLKEIHQLESVERFILMEEINQLSLLMNNYFKPDKLNIGALGNVVSQLHVHIIGRKVQDALWPQGIWQPSLTNIHYDETLLNSLLPELKIRVREAGMKIESVLPDFAR